MFIPFRMWLLACLFVIAPITTASSTSDDYTKKYTDKWPNCRNIKCFGVGTRSLEQMRMECNKYNLCSGFSNHKASNGGCLKICYDDESSSGYGTGGYDYYEKDYTRRYTIKWPYTKKYTNKWPNCWNITCFGRNTRSLEQMRMECNKYDNCSGFSTHTSFFGGCLKICGDDDSFNGYGTVAHDYYEKDYTRKYTNKWPNCRNIQCFGVGTINPDQMRMECNKYDNCSGFSIHKILFGGCLKICGDDDSFNGYGTGGYDYFKKSQASQIKSKNRQKLLRCEVYCDSDFDCGRGLMCLQRKNVHITPLGCKGSPTTDADYCAKGASPPAKSWRASVATSNFNNSAKRYLGTGQYTKTRVLDEYRRVCKYGYNNGNNCGNWNHHPSKRAEMTTCLVPQTYWRPYQSDSFSWFELLKVIPVVGDLLTLGEGVYEVANGNPGGWEGIMWGVVGLGASATTAGMGHAAKTAKFAKFASMSTTAKVRYAAIATSATNIGDSAKFIGNLKSVNDIKGFLENCDEVSVRSSGNIGELPSSFVSISEMTDALDKLNSQDNGFMYNRCSDLSLPNSSSGEMLFHYVFGGILFHFLVAKWVKERIVTIDLQFYITEDLLTFINEWRTSNDVLECETTYWRVKGYLDRLNSCKLVFNPNWSPIPYNQDVIREFGYVDNLARMCPYM